ncbi:MAG: hypothetical protein Tsb0020_30420 [Haliangiales bacterium]
MYRIARIGTLLCACALLFACQRDSKETSATPAPTEQETDSAESGGDTAEAAAPAPGDIPAPDDVAAPPADAQKTESGLAYKTLTEGSGDKPTAADTVVVHYTGWTTDGKMFDSSSKRGEPARFPLGRVIPGWTEGLQLVAKGGKARLWIPEELAYKGQPGRPQGMLVFDVELIDIIAAPKTPEDVAAPPADAQKTDSGLAYKIFEAGDGDKPQAWDEVEVHYSGWTTDGKMFDSSVTRGQPAKFPLNGVIPGWTEGLQLMAPGGKARLWIPEELAYKGQPGRPQGMLVFDVELLSVNQKPEPPPVPDDVAEPPKDAKKTEKGVFYKVLKAGTGTDKPTAASKVEVHYTGWTTDGKMFDSSITRGEPASFSLGAVIPGWTDGLQTMVVGEKTRFWIPEELAYKGRRGAPQGMLVFDVELLKIE